MYHHFCNLTAPEALSDRIQNVVGIFVGRPGELDWLHPGRLTWNLQITHLERKNDLPNLHDYGPRWSSRVYADDR